MFDGTTLFVVNIMKANRDNPVISARVQVRTETKLEALEYAVLYLKENPSAVPKSFHSLHVREDTQGYVYIGGK